MKKRKHKYKALLSEKDFTELMAPKKIHHFDLPSEAIPEDENSNQLKETLAGMEYDSDVRELLEDEDFFSDNVPDEDAEYELDEKEDEALRQEASP